ncbi:MAG: DivIVA domain-containing protein [Actinomycetota bacterium]|nr:DivIVA domain-containing protein [Actinomycetota bacterium]
MPLTPADVHNVTFSKPPIGKRGYSEDEVDVFLDLVGAELARLIQGTKDLRNQVETGSVRPWVKAKTSPGPEHDVQAAKVLAMAQQVADLLTGDAKAQVDGMSGEARIKSEQLLGRCAGEGPMTWSTRPEPEPRPCSMTPVPRPRRDLSGVTTPRIEPPRTRRAGRHNAKPAAGCGRLVRRPCRSRERARVEPPWPA